MCDACISNAVALFRNNFLLKLLFDISVTVSSFLIDCDSVFFDALQTLMNVKSFQTSVRMDSASILRDHVVASAVLDTS